MKLTFDIEIRDAITGEIVDKKLQREMKRAFVRDPLKVANAESHIRLLMQDSWREWLTALGAVSRAVNKLETEATK